MPTFDPATWRLSIEGLVDRPQTLTYADAAQPAARESGLGLPLRHGLVGRPRALGRRPLQGSARRGAAAVDGDGAPVRLGGVPVCRHADPEQAELHDAMLAYEMNGKPLPREHGAPVRVVIPEMYGYKNVKWVAEDRRHRPRRRRATGSSAATTSTRGSASRMASSRTGRVFTSAPRYIHRFSRTERTLHWVHAAAFFVLLGSGLVLYLPKLSELVGRRALRQGRPLRHRARLDASRSRSSSCSATGAACAGRSASSTLSIATTASGSSASRGRRAASTQL